MKFCEFEKVMPAKRMTRYVNACGGNTRKAMALYRLNLRLAEEMFTIAGGVFDDPKFHNNSNSRYKATGRQLLKTFPNKPKSTPALQHNNQFIFNNWMQ